MSRAIFEIEADLAQLRTELDSARRKNDDLGKGFELTQSRAQRLADEGLRGVAGVSRHLAQVLGDIADKSPGLAAALKKGKREDPTSPQTTTKSTTKPSPQVRPPAAEAGLLPWQLPAPAAPVPSTAARSRVRL